MRPTSHECGKDSSACNSGKGGWGGWFVTSTQLLCYILLEILTKVSKHIIFIIFTVCEHGRAYAHVALGWCEKTTFGIQFSPKVLGIKVRFGCQAW